MENIVGMKALSVKNPCAWLILKFGKDVENRTWKTEYRGRILIHASKELDPNWWMILKDAFSPWKRGDSFQDKWTEVQRTWCGCIVGSVELVDCVQDSKSPWAEKGLWHWVLKNPVLFDKPIPARGSLGLWEYKG